MCLLLATVAQGGPESQGPWAEDARERSESWSGWHWWKLVDAAASVEFEWSSQTHGAVPTALACRAVWLYLHDVQARPGVDVLRETCWQEREDAWEVERALQQQEADTEKLDWRRDDPPRIGPRSIAGMVETRPSTNCAYYSAEPRGAAWIDGHPSRCLLSPPD